MRLMGWLDRCNDVLMFLMICVRSTCYVPPFCLFLSCFRSVSNTGVTHNETHFRWNVDIAIDLSSKLRYHRVDKQEAF